METVGLRELRQDASGLLRRVERGEEIEITVSGRPSARLVPARQTRWHRWDDVADLFAGPSDAEWTADRELLEDAVRDPWAGQ
ncbi:prevent-host-death protein [Serinicoccus sp. CUA-874]|uniref:type II toxin-antitoxin system Phd/YefM family antitoxin n=1 Tax=Serinicoccus sp. CUA-874 TaxID=1517939 RepID=UPI000964D397|nr:type II toxin-antitoxin system prevent-host-death family antitoxin [Serinicoccus sp. CUA-874]OLT17991.1 prevent-host-death protein [Serinicoccus sp. CUA-874]